MVITKYIYLLEDVDILYMRSLVCASSVSLF